jgi:hypothetical protein
MSATRLPSSEELDDLPGRDLVVVDEPLALPVVHNVSRIAAAT